MDETGSQEDAALSLIVMVDRLGKSGTRTAWNQRALPSGAETFWVGVRRTPVRWAKHRPHLNLM